MRGFILAAGFGTRMGPLSKVVPKPLVPLGGLSVVHFALEKLRRVGVKQAVLNLHYGAEFIRREIGDKASGIDIHYSYEAEILGTAGGLKHAEDFLRETGEPFFVLNADAVSNADLRAALDHHQKHHFLATLILRRSRKAASFGSLAVDETGRLHRFLQSEAPGEPTGACTEAMFTGLSVLSPEFLDHIPAGRSSNISKEIYPRLIENGLPIGAILTEAYWADVGTPARYLEASFDLLEGKFMPEFNWPPEGYILVEGKPLEWGGGIVRPPTLLGEGVQLCEEAIAGPFAILGSGAILDSRASVEHSVILPGGGILERTQVERCIVGPNAKVSPSGKRQWLEHFFLSKEKQPIPF